MLGLVLWLHIQCPYPNILEPRESRNFPPGLLSDLHQTKREMGTCPFQPLPGQSKFPTSPIATPWGSQSESLNLESPQLVKFCLGDEDIRVGSALEDDNFWIKGFEDPKFQPWFCSCIAAESVRYRHSPAYNGLQSIGRTDLKMCKTRQWLAWHCSCLFVCLFSQTLQFDWEKKCSATRREPSINNTCLKYFLMFLPFKAHQPTSWDTQALTYADFARSRTCDGVQGYLSMTDCPIKIHSLRTLIGRFLRRQKSLSQDCTPKPFDFQILHHLGMI